MLGSDDGRLTVIFTHKRLEALGVHVALLPMLLQEFLLWCRYILILLIDHRKGAGDQVR
jgi:hypothetical protein